MGWSTKNVELWDLWGGGGEGQAPPPPPPPLPTGLMKFIKGKDNGNGPYFPSATRNSTSTDKAEAVGALILHPSLHQFTILRVFKATRKGKKSKQRFEVLKKKHLGIVFGNSRALTHYATCWFSSQSWTFNGSDHRSTSLNVGLTRCNILIIYAVFNHVFSSYTNVLDKRKVFARVKSSIPHKTIVVNQHGHHFGTTIWS